jgi:formamidopyrimidine-DNA glycosylase
MGIHQWALVAPEVTLLTWSHFVPTYKPKLQKLVAEWAARLHPKTGCPSLSDEDIVQFYTAIREVLSGAVGEVFRRGEPVEVKVRDFLRLRNRKGQLCPACGTTVRVEGVCGHDTFYCPACQPDRPEARLGRRQLVDWSRLPNRGK